ncbi:MAG TPA: FAD-dependent oxidoreductase [Xanthobacteraceae bacterium]|jgi:gamma-glutamylputrescine oxidase
MRQSTAYDEEVREFSPPTAANQNLTCDLLVAGGGLSGLSAAEAALRRGLEVVVIEKGVYGKDAASGLNAGQFLTGWAKPVDVMLADLQQQERRRGVAAERAELNARQRVRAFLRRTVEGCLRLAELDRHYNLRASVQRGALTAAISATDLASLRAAYQFMEKSNLRALMPPADKRRPPFFEVLSARQLQKRYGTAEGLYAGGIIDRFGGSFRPRKFLIGLAQALQKRGVRLFQHTEAVALDFADGQVSVFCDNGASIRANMLFMANAYARHINGDALERAIFEYDYVVEVELPEGARTLAAGSVLSDTRDPCFYARRHGRRLYMGYEETAETSPEILGAVARNTLAEGKRVFPALDGMDERDIRSAWSGRVYYTLDDYPFVERRHGARVVTFAAPSDHGNSLALRIGELVGSAAVRSGPAPKEDETVRRRGAQQLRLFESFPKGLRLRPGRRYQEAAFRPEPAAPEPDDGAAVKPSGPA